MDFQSIKVLSYNIRSCYGLNWIFNQEPVAEAIRKVKPDLCGLQEVRVVYQPQFADTPAFLGESAAMNHYFGKTFHRVSEDKKDEFDYGIANLSALPSELVEVIELPWPKGSELRVAVVLKIHHPEGDFFFINTHFSFEDELEDERLLQMRTILDAVKEKHYSPAILTGDFNARPDAPCVKELEKEWQTANHGTLTFPTHRKQKRQIDYIAYYPKTAFSVASIKVVDEPEASDHYPVLAELFLHFKNPQQ